MGLLVSCIPTTSFIHYLCVGLLNSADSLSNCIIAMPATPDLSLPPKAPTESCHNESHNCDKLAVYTLVDLGEADINSLLKALENKNKTVRGAYCLPSKYNFTGASLKDVYDYHLQLGTDKGYHPTLFIVAQHEDYEKNGVLLVNLDTDMKCSVDTCRMKVSKALSAGMNLMIGNMDWEDFKEDELPSARPASVGESSSAQIRQTIFQQAAQSSTPQYVFGVYTTAGADMTALRGLLEPDWREKAPKRHLCESIGSYTDYADPWEELIKHHPWNCRRNPRLHRQWLICADEKDPKEKGVLLVRIDWDGDSSRDPDELLRLGLGLKVKTERVLVEGAIVTLTTLATKEQKGQ